VLTLVFRKMPRVKHTAVRERPAKRYSGSEQFFDEAIPSDTPKQDQAANIQAQQNAQKFLNDNKLRRYEQIKRWGFIAERRVELKPEDCDPFLMGILRRNWKRLAEPLKKFDAEIVREFYSNAYLERQERHRRKTIVRGRWIKYSPQVIDDLLENPYRRQDEQCHYQRLCGRKKGFSNRKVAAVLCMPGKGYQLTEAGKETRIRRRDMRTLAQVWLTFLLANVMPTGHVSDINVAKSNLLFSMMQDDFTINIARVISDEIQKVVDEERVGRGERRGTLGFPALITAGSVCGSKGEDQSSN